MIDLSNGDERIEDQGPAPLCMRFVATGLLENNAARAGQPVQLSTQYTYSFNKTAWNVPTILDTVVNQYGICFDSSLPYDPTRTNRFPTDAMIDEGRALIPPGSVKYKSINGVDEIVRALGEGSSVAVTINVNDEYTYCVPNGGWGGRWQNSEWDIFRPKTGEHEVLIMGYDPDISMFKVMGSFGVNHFDHGWHGIKAKWVEQGLVTTATRLVESAWPLVPFPGYVSPPVPFWDGSHLHVQRAALYRNSALEMYEDCVFEFVDGKYGDITPDNTGPGGYTNIFKLAANEAFLPLLDAFGKRHRDVLIRGADLRLVSRKPT